MTWRLLRSNGRLYGASAMALALTACGGSAGGPNSTIPIVVVPTPTPTPTPTPNPAPTPTPAPVQALSCTAADNVRRITGASIYPIGGGIVIVAIGSSSTAGSGASTYATAYPAVLQALLNGLGSSIFHTVINRGVGGDRLIDIQARLQRDALDAHPQLIVLQAGTNDANGPQSDEMVAAYANRLRAVISQIRGSSQIILMNGQHFPAEGAYYQKYQAAMDAVSVEMSVPLFDRYALMKSWIDSGKYKYNDILYSDLFHPNDLTYQCMAKVVSEVVVARTVR